MPRFSASLDYLWSELPLVDRIQAAAAAGFCGVECHWPFDEDAAMLSNVLGRAGLPLVSINTPRGEVDRGEFGLAAVRGRGAETRDGIDRAVDYARAVGARNVHVMAGCVDDDAAAHSTFLTSVGQALERAAPHGIGILLEPINRVDRPGYFLHTVAQARAIIDELAAPGVRLLFDCYHVKKSGGDPMSELNDNLDVIGHVQVASVPDRSEPVAGEIDYPRLFERLDDIGYRGYVGAEYRPRHTTDAGLGWHEPYRIDARGRAW